MKPVHWAMIAAAAYLYYLTQQRKTVAVIPVLPPFDQNTQPSYEEGFVAPKFPHTPTPAYAYSGMGHYEQGLNWPPADKVFG